MPDLIRIGTFYDGSEVHVSAITDSCDGAVIVIEGKDQEVTLNRKGRVAVIWMNVARITIDGLPRAYILAATGKLDNICSKETQDELSLGLESLRSRTEISSDQSLTGTEFKEYLKLKIRDGTYSVNNTASLSPSSGGKEEISSILPVSSVTPPGEYDIHVYCFRQGRLFADYISQLTIERIGLPGLLMNLASKHSALYGILAIIAAMVVGLIMGIIFSSLPGGRRKY